jgi:hypothetical protein
MLAIFVFIAMAFGFYLVAMIRRAWVARRERRRAQILARLVPAFVGSPLERVMRTFGPPASVYEGTTGRTLYIWHPPHGEAVPTGEGLVIVSMTVAASGAVDDATWRIVR